MKIGKIRRMCNRLERLDNREKWLRKEMNKTTGDEHIDFEIQIMRIEELLEAQKNMLGRYLAGTLREWQTKKMNHIKEEVLTFEEVI